MDEFNFLKILPQASVPEAPSDLVRAWGVGVRCEQICQERCSKLEALQTIGSGLRSAKSSARSLFHLGSPPNHWVGSQICQEHCSKPSALEASQTIGSGVWLPYAKNKTTMRIASQLLQYPLAHDPSAAELSTMWIMCWL